MKKARISVNVVMEKQFDLNNINDYDGEIYRKYKYTVSITGNLDSVHKGRTIFLYLNFVSEYHVARFNGVDEKGIVSENGEFSYSYDFTSNAILTEWIPYRVEFGQ